MKKLLIMLSILAIVPLIGCSQEPEPIFEKYNEDIDFMQCYAESYEEFLEAKKEGKTGFSKDIEAELEKDVVKELIANTCLKSLAEERKDIGLCQDLYIDKTKTMYKEFSEGTGIAPQVTKIPTTTDQLIMMCQEHVNIKVEYEKELLEKGVNILTVYGEDGTDGDIEVLHAAMKIKAGTDEVDLKQMDIIYELEGKITRTVYSGNCEEAGGYSYKTLLEGSNHSEGYLRTGDIVRICFRTAQPIDKEKNITIKITPEGMGTETFNLKIPEDIEEKRINLYP